MADESGSNGLKSEEPASTKPRTKLLVGVCYGSLVGLSGFIERSMKVPGPVALGGAFLLAQLVLWAVPSTRREYRNFGDWVKMTLVVIAAVMIVAYLFLSLSRFLTMGAGADRAKSRNVEDELSEILER